MRRGLYLALLAVVAFSTLIASAQGSCVKRHGVLLDKGKSPTGLPWSVEGTIGNNGSCREWLFGMEFEIEGAAYWGWGTGIPAGGHLRRGFNIETSDDLLEDGSYRVVSGTVDAEVAKVQFTLSNNGHLVIRPKATAERLRHKVVWLRNVRYFVDYYPPEGFVTGVATFDASGRLLYRDKTFEGF